MFPPTMSPTVTERGLHKNPYATQPMKDLLLAPNPCAPCYLRYVSFAQVARVRKAKAEVVSVDSSLIGATTLTGTPAPRVRKIVRRGSRRKIEASAHQMRSTVDT